MPGVRVSVDSIQLNFTSVFQAWLGLLEGICIKSTSSLKTSNEVTTLHATATRQGSLKTALLPLQPQTSVNTTMATRVSQSNQGPLPAETSVSTQPPHRSYSIQGPSPNSHHTEKGATRARLRFRHSHHTATLTTRDQ